MWSILRLLTAASLCSLAACQIEQRVPPSEPLSTEPIPTDAAMQARHWPVSHVIYANDVVTAWPTYELLRSAGGLPRIATIFVEPALFVANVVNTPIDMSFRDHPWTPIDYKSLQMNPTYTAMPPLPPSPPPPVW